MTRSQNLLLRLIAGATIVLWGTAIIYAGSVSLPFNETFNTTSMDATFSTDYPAFTTTGSLTRSVDAGGILRLGGGGFPASTWTTVTPSPTPGGGILINVDMGWDGKGQVAPGFGAAALTLGNNVLAFHPGYSGSPPGALRVEGPGGLPNSDMGFVPAMGVLHHVQILSSPSGLFTIKVTDGSNPANVFTTSFTNPSSYGGEIGPAALAGAEGMFDNLSITAVPEPTSLAVGAVGLIGVIASGGRRFCRLVGA